MTDQSRWQAVQGRDDAADGRFVYAVTTTGIYCRPTCAARRPLRRNVRFFDLPEAAEQEAGEEEVVDSDIQQIKQEMVEMVVEVK